jgi:hypothetical protein
MEPELKIGNIDNTRSACQILIWVALQTVEATNGAQPTDKRVRVLRLSMLRAARIAQAALLLEEHDFAEEALSLARTLAEVVISGCYLQIADDQKVESFLSFDIQKSYKMSATLEEFMAPEEMISDENRKELKAIVSKAGTRSKRKDTDKSWNNETVYEMAKKLDATMAGGVYLFTMLKATTFESGHPFVHGTYGSFGSVRQWLSDGTFPADERRAEQRFHAAEGVYQCLSTLCVYVNERFRLPFRQHILNAKLLNERE